MTLKDLELILELNGVMQEDIDAVLEFSKKNAMDVERIDDELVKIGYERIVENELDESWDEDDEEYEHMEKFSHRHRYMHEYD